MTAMINAYSDSIDPLATIILANVTVSASPIPSLSAFLSQMGNQNSVPNYNSLEY
ncbi:MAG: hypothetical protein NXI23_24650 [Bacteroidetes bacterium]|nr:hypothetical protein [Bacteroidota bacterium]